MLKINTKIKYLQIHEKFEQLKIRKFKPKCPNFDAIIFAHHNWYDERAFEMEYT